MAGSLFIAATVTAIAPRVWGVLNAHTQVPPSLTNFSGLAQRSTVFDATGKQIGSYQLENSQVMSIDNVPLDVVSAILALEDNEFERHKGVNLRAFTRAILSNSRGGAKQGASTITMQVVKTSSWLVLNAMGVTKFCKHGMRRCLKKKSPRKDS